MNTRDFFPHLATFVCFPNLLVDCECGKNEREDFIALIEGDLLCLCAKVCPHGFKSVRASESKMETKA